MIFKKTHPQFDILRNGILVLMIPPILISAGIAYLAYKKRKSFRNENETQNFGW